MRVAIITESCPPDVNGVANSVQRVATHLVHRGHQPLVIAPQPRRSLRAAPATLPAPVVRIPSLPLPGYTNVRLALPTARIRAALAEFQPDIVHLASPFILGAWGSRVARDLGLPMVAVYQTDVPGYTASYGLGRARDAAWRWVARIHGRAARTLAPSTITAAQLREHGVPGVVCWRRGVDSALFHPSHRDQALRRTLLGPRAEVLVGYVGRLAREKSVELLATTARLPGVRVVIIGDGPLRGRLERAMPDAVFLGGRGGRELATLYASLDIFVHTGAWETFGQTIQEAQASGVPVVAPASGGPLDLVTPGRTGYLVRRGDPEGFAVAVAALRDDPARRAAYGRAARAEVADRTWTAIGDEIIGHYRAAMGATMSTMELVP